MNSSLKRAQLTSFAALLFCTCGTALDDTIDASLEPSNEPQAEPALSSTELVVPPAPELQLIAQANAHVWVDPALEFSQSVSYSRTDPKGGLLLTSLWPFYQPNLPASQSIALNAVPAEGLRDPNDVTSNALRFGIVRDLRGKRVIRTRMVRGQPPVVFNGNSTHRVLMTLDSSIGGADVKHIPHNSEVWVAIALRAPNPIYRGKVEQGTGASCGDNTLDLFSVSTSRAGDSSLYLQLQPGNVLSFMVNSNQTSSRATTVWNQKPPDVPMGLNQWSYVVMKLRLSHTNSVTSSPSTKIWVAAGEQAPLRLIYDRRDPNAWKPSVSDSLYPYSIIRVGPYSWCRSTAGAPPPDPWTPLGADVFTLDQGGTYVLPVSKTPGVTEAHLLAFLKQKTL